LLKGNMDATFTMPNRGATGLSTRAADGRLILNQPPPGSPGEKAGLKQGDIVLSIDGKDVRGLGSGATSFLLAGKAGTQTAIVVESQGGGTRTVNVDRVDPASLRRPQ
jgi:carboxyl-terminal processing protease